MNDHTPPLQIARDAAQHVVTLFQQREDARIAWFTYSDRHSIDAWDALTLDEREAELIERARLQACYKTLETQSREAGPDLLQAMTNIPLSDALHRAMCRTHDLIQAWQQARQIWHLASSDVQKAIDNCVSERRIDQFKAVRSIAYGKLSVAEVYLDTWLSKLAEDFLAFCPITSIQGISPDTETDLDPQNHEVPDNTARKLTVRDIIDQIHTAARDHRQDVPGARDAQYILNYIERKEAEAIAIPGRGGAVMERAIRHIFVTRNQVSGINNSERIRRIEKIAEQALTAISQAVQS